eukprot:1139334-Pelagomonas_calceolata.AAC.1
MSIQKGCARARGGYAWMEAALAPCPVCRWWRHLSPRWQRLVKRNTSGQVDPAGFGPVWGQANPFAAYRMDRMQQWNAAHGSQASLHPRMLTQ